ncbi:hypothetical protein ACFX13_011514 [Malus domestica]
MIGVHGAALTHQVFLRPGSVFVQVVPIGLHWAADAFYGKVAKDLNLEYIEYRIGVDESCLVDKYGNKGLLLKDPYALLNKDKNGWPPTLGTFTCANKISASYEPALEIVEVSNGWWQVEL